MMNKQGNSTWLKYVVMGWPAVVLALGGCADDPSSDPASGGPDGAGDPLYAMTSLVFSPDFSSRTEYLMFAHSLEADAKIDESKTIELTSENATLWGMQDTGEFFLAESETGLVVKYALGDDGNIKKVGELSFDAYGVTSFYWAAISFASKSKAYLFDEITLQGFVWDPSTMAILSNVDLAGAFNSEEEGKQWAVYREKDMLRVGSKFVTAFHYWDIPSFAGLGRSGMLVIDTETDEFSVAEHPTCGGLHNSMVGPDGYVYSATGVAYAAASRAGTAGVTSPCMVRFDPEKKAFDDTFMIDLNALAGGKTVGGLVEHSATSAYVRVLNDELVPEDVPFTAGQRILSSLAWETYRIDDVTAPATATHIDMPVSSYMVYPSRVDEHTYIVDTDFAANKSTVFSVTTDPPTPGLVGDGWITYVLRVN